VSAFQDEVRAAVAAELEPVREELRQLRAALDTGKARVTLQAYRGGSARANAAFERRHPELLALAVGKVGKRRVYRSADLDAFFGGAK
jgi:hypothetical protein